MQCTLPFMFTLMHSYLQVHAEYTCFQLRHVVTSGLSCVFSLCVLKTGLGEEERLIEAVRCLPCLWQVSCTHYKNAQARENAWEQVAKQVRDHVAVLVHAECVYC